MLCERFVQVATRQCAASVESVDRKWKALISMLHVAAKKKHSAVPLLITLPRCCYVLQSCLNVVVVNIGYDTWHISVAYFWCDGAVHCGWGRVHPAYSRRVLYQLFYHKSPSTRCLRKKQATSISVITSATVDQSSLCCSCPKKWPVFCDTPCTGRFACDGDVLSLWSCQMSAQS